MSQTRVEGTIRKALSGFYYVQTEQTLVTCRARGKFGYQKVTPLVGDRVEVTGLEDAVCFVGKEMPFFERLRTRGFVTDMASGAKHK